MIEPAILAAVVAIFGGLFGTALVLMPGYVMNQTYSRGARGPEPSQSTFAARAAIGGVVTHALFIGWTVPLATHLVPRYARAEFVELGQVTLWVIVVLLVAPALIGAAFAHLSAAESSFVHVPLHWLGLCSDKRTAQAWDWVFQGIDRRNEGVWLRVFFEDSEGSYLGLFARNSLVSSDMSTRDLYLEQFHELDDDGEPLADGKPNRGVWIAGRRILAIEIYDPPTDRGSIESGTADVEPTD